MMVPMMVALTDCGRVDNLACGKVGRLVVRGAV